MAQQMSMRFACVSGGPAVFGMVRMVQWSPAALSLGRDRKFPGIPWLARAYLGFITVIVVVISLPCATMLHRSQLQLQLRL